MSLREQFEDWLAITTETHLVKNESLYWQAFQAGHAASGRDELLAALKAIIDDDTEFPSIYRKLSENARFAIKKAMGEQ
jgi:hypothetical protein